MSNSTPLLHDQEGALCRFCHGGSESGEEGELLCPCLCRGSVHWVHRGCLDHWRGKAGSSPSCELCGFAYRYELRKATFGETLSSLLANSSSGLLALSVLGFLLSKAGPPAAALLAIGLVSFMWALADVLLSVVSYRHPNMPPRGVLIECILQVEVAFRDKASARQSAERLAQAAAAGEAEAAMAGVPSLGSGGDEEAPGLGSDDSACRSVRLGCGRRLKLLVAPLFSAAWLALCWLLDRNGVHALVGVFAGLGFGYWVLVGLGLAGAAAARPPLRAVCGEKGLPVVRSISELERELASALRTP